MPPPPWTEDHFGTELDSPPICSRCANDWEAMQDPAEVLSTRRSRKRETPQNQDEDFKSASPSVLSQTQRAASDSTFSKSSVKHDVPVSRKRARVEDSMSPSTKEAKRKKSAKLDDVSESMPLLASAVYNAEKADTHLRRRKSGELHCTTTICIYIQSSRAGPFLQSWRISAATEMDGALTFQSRQRLYSSKAFRPYQPSLATGIFTQS